MVDVADFSWRVRGNPLASSPAGLERLSLGMRRIQSVLEREQAAAIRTLEMKISDGGPNPQRVEPHILGVAGVELMERGFVKAHQHPSTGTHNWFAPARLTPQELDVKLQQLIPVYQETTAPGFTASLGDPLEISVFKILHNLKQKDPRFAFFGSFDLSGRRPSGRYAKTEPPISVSGTTLNGPPDFFLFHPASGETALIECKNVREWLYPSSGLIKEMLAKALYCDMVPIIIARRIPYITKVALCVPAGIIAHETYNQLYPDTPYGHQLAERVSKVRGLGYSDVRASEEPLQRTVTFFEKNLPIILPQMAERFRANKPILQKWVDGMINWTDLRLHLAADYKEPDQDMPF